MCEVWPCEIWLRDCVGIIGYRGTGEREEESARGRRKPLWQREAFYLMFVASPPKCSRVNEVVSSGSFQLKSHLIWDFFFFF